MIYLTAIGLKPGGSSTVHIYTKTIHRTANSLTDSLLKNNSNFHKHFPHHLYPYLSNRTLNTVKVKMNTETTANSFFFFA